jgi:RNA polymerase sigma-70 factor (ECF subfamily)
MLRSRKSRPAEPIDAAYDVAADTAADPAQEVEIADSVGLAMLVVLETLTPAERLAFVLHDMFAVPFEEIAPIVGRTPTAARQLASRARRRVQGASASGEADQVRQREVVSAFLAASREGNFERLLAVLDPSVVLRADPAAMAMGAAAYFGASLNAAGEISGAQAVAQTFAGRARAAQLAVVDGSAAAAWVQGGQLRVVFAMTVTDGRITAIELVADTERLSHMNVEIL